jgi:hypothetical protein
VNDEYVRFILLLLSVDSDGGTLEKKLLFRVPCVVVVWIEELISFALRTASSRPHLKGFHSDS